ncbi:interleukin-12 receptor subunit beta-1 [Mugil cephalus]|uniref:interleukin-12 receptor subunit beta-1 n=1 Tax=Mugil cephalus TaxID=48193 RepID=UPI001FB7B300|nr:interleukin-12 receptor subunit beta-1 [Mugil cephalus]
MITFLSFPLCLMETFNCRSSLLHGYVLFMFLTTIGRGLCLGCNAPSSPWCFRRNATENVYICEWSMNSDESNVMFDLYYNETKLGTTNKTWCKCNEELLIQYRPVDIWVQARVGDSRCKSPRNSVVLRDIIKYDAPRNISPSWLKNSLSLRWLAAEKSPALAEVWFRRDEHGSESWKKILINTTTKAAMYHVTIANLVHSSAYQFQIRHQSTVARNPLWSQWSEVVIVPAELQHKPEVTMTKLLEKGTQKVVLTWKPVPKAAAVRGVTYSLTDTQSSASCPCERKGQHTSTNKYTIYLSYSAANISVIARNAAGHSPSAVIQVPAEFGTNFSACDKSLHNNIHKRRKATCLELYEFQNEDQRPTNKITFPKRMKKVQKKQMIASIKDYVRYIYFEHQCKGGKPETVTTCLYYHKEGVPRSPPRDLIALSITESSVRLSWQPIPLVDHRGFLNLSLCFQKISSDHEPMECHNLSASVTEYNLENLTSETKYNIRLTGVTQVGEGPRATVVVNTRPEKSFNVGLSFGFLLVFFLLSTTCTIFMKRLKSKIFPSVPTPVIPDFTSSQPNSQDVLLEKKEVVHQLTLYQPHPEEKSFSEEAEEATVLRGECDGEIDEDVDNERSNSTASECVSPGSTDQVMRNSEKGETTDLEQVDEELALLIYRNGLVFDLKTDLS